jgi:hypothetical protein
MIRGGNNADAQKILNENDFFSLPENCDYPFDNDDDDINFEIRFHYDLDNFDVYNVRVAGVIDCTCVKGCRVVLSCEGYELIKSIRPQPPKKVEEAGKKKDAAPQNRRSIFDVFDDFIGCSSKFQDLFDFSLPKFLSDFDSLANDTRKQIEEIRKNGDGKFYDFSCRIDPDGNVHVKRISNDGTVEKTFKIGDDDGGEEPVKIPIKNSDPKTELKNLL